MLACFVLAVVAVAAPVRPTAGIVDNALVEPYEWAKGDDAAAWAASRAKGVFEAAGFSTRILG